MRVPVARGKTTCNIVVARSSGSSREGSDEKIPEREAYRLDEIDVHLNILGMAITPKAIQDLLDELESSKQSRLRAWNVLQRLRLVLSDTGNVAIPPPA